MTSFLRHFSLYEFAFKPRVELVLRSEPIFKTRFNADLTPLNQMQEVDEEEAKKMQNFLRQMNLQSSHHNSGIAVDSIAEHDVYQPDMHDVQSQPTV